MVYGIGSLKKVRTIIGTGPVPGKLSTYLTLILDGPKLKSIVTFYVMDFAVFLFCHLRWPPID